jgi:hypothetical protein
LHVPERSFDGCELFARQHEDALAGCAAAVTFSEDLGQFANGKPDCESASDEADALERLRRKQPVFRRKSATGRSLAEQSAMYLFRFSGVMRPF